MALVTANFNFNGHCSEAIDLYCRAFGARIGCLLRYCDAEDFSRELTQEQKQYVYHAELFIGNQRLMMCDNLDIPFQPSLSLSLVVTLDTREEVLAAYEALKANAQQIIYPPATTTYSSCFTSLVDSFGFRWGIMTEQTER